MVQVGQSWYLPLKRQLVDNYSAVVFLQNVTFVLWLKKKNHDIIIGDIETVQKKEE
jgi:hypothetical protein